MLPPEDSERAAREADCHVQLAIEAVERAPDAVRLTGTVRRVFRGPRSLHGTPLRLTVPSPGDDDWAPDGAGRVPAESLRVGRVLEAYVDRAPDGPTIVADLYAVLDALTDAPRLEG